MLSAIFDIRTGPPIELIAFCAFPSVFHSVYSSIKPDAPHRTDAPPAVIIHSSQEIGLWMNFETILTPELLHRFIVFFASFVCLYLVGRTTVMRQIPSSNHPKFPKGLISIRLFPLGILPWLHSLTSSVHLAGSVIDWDPSRTNFLNFKIELVQPIWNWNKIHNFKWEIECSVSVGFETDARGAIFSQRAFDWFPKRKYWNAKKVIGLIPNGEFEWVTDLTYTHTDTHLFHSICVHNSV